MEIEEAQKEIETREIEQRRRKTSLEEQREMVIRCLSKPRMIHGQLVTPEKPTEEEILREMNSLDDMMTRYTNHTRLTAEEIEIKGMMNTQHAK
jgi:hypothetical protein